jgi:CubicO group peptidase (beta-lactamase class C family)
MDASNRRLAADRAIAVGHRVDPLTGSVDRVTKRMPTSLGPAGNVVATAESLVRFADALFGESEALLPASLVNEMLAPQIAVRETHQALGWMLLPAPVPVATHGGSTIGYTAFLGAIPALQTSIAVVANGPGAGAIASAIYAQRSGNGLVPPPVTTQALDLDVARLVAGRYARRHVTQDVELLDGALLARTTFLGPAAELFPQPPPAVLEPIGGLHFVSRQPFEPDASRWEFDDPDNSDNAGRPARLFTQRVHVREPA